MERKHQVFVSSTYQDLQDERKEVIHALLELDCIPAGMELFPATDEDAWSLIKEIIDGCDYYLLILGGKYGSTNSDGIGYTELEYDYAVSISKPIICFLHEDPDDLPSSKTEKTDIGKEKLKLFREKAQQKHCKYWTNAHDLGGKASRSLVQLKKKHPSAGWVPGKYAVDQKMLNEAEMMRSRIAELETMIASFGAPPANIDELSHGDNIYELDCMLNANGQGDCESISLVVSWDTIFRYCGANMVGECTDKELREKIRLAYWHAVPEEIEPYNSCTELIITHVDMDQIKVQLQALGLIQYGTKKRAVSDTNTYWKLTPYGERYLIQISALKRDTESSGDTQLQ